MKLFTVKYTNNEYVCLSATKDFELVFDEYLSFMWGVKEIDGRIYSYVPTLKEKLRALNEIIEFEKENYNKEEEMDGNKIYF